MRTTLTLDEAIVNDVISLTQISNRSEAIREALAAYVKMKNKEKLLALRGKVNIEDNWEQLREMEIVDE